MCSTAPVQAERQPRDQVRRRDRRIEFIKPDPACDAFAQNGRRPFIFVPAIVVLKPIVNEAQRHLPRGVGADGAQIAQMHSGLPQRRGRRVLEHRTLPRDQRQPGLRIAGPRIGQREMQAFRCLAGRKDFLVKRIAVGNVLNAAPYLTKNFGRRFHASPIALAPQRLNIGCVFDRAAPETRRARD